MVLGGFDNVALSFRGHTRHATKSEIENLGRSQNAKIRLDDYEKVDKLKDGDHVRSLAHHLDELMLKQE